MNIDISRIELKRLFLMSSNGDALLIGYLLGILTVTLWHKIIEALKYILKTLRERRKGIKEVDMKVKE